MEELGIDEVLQASQMVAGNMFLNMVIAEAKIARLRSDLAALQASTTQDAETVGEE